MFVNNLDWKSFEKSLNEYQIVILGVGSENSILNSFFCGSLMKLNRIGDKRWFVGMMNQEEYLKMKKIRLFPAILVYQNHQLLQTIYGFKNYKRIYDELNIEKVA